MMGESEYKYYFEILKHNGGFQNPQPWMNYAQKHGFKKVRALILSECPDCKRRDSRKIGQYIYYSHLIGIRVCTSCGLIYSDTIIDENVIKAHFETAYKDEKYFSRKESVFLQIAKLVSQRLPQKGKLIDIGGATGELAKKVSDIRPDVEITVSDLSAKACDTVTSKLGFKTICCQLKDLPSLTGNYDAAVLSDVLYYETKIDEAWLTLSKLINHGTVIIRIPNKILPMRISLFMKRLLLSKKKQEMLDHVNFFNPEHIYVFSRNYLKRRLEALGLKKITFMPSKLLSTSRMANTLLGHVVYFLAIAAYYLSFRKVVITPSQLVYARK